MSSDLIPPNVPAIPWDDFRDRLRLIRDSLPPASSSPPVGNPVEEAPRVEAGGMPTNEDIQRNWPGEKP